MKNGKVLSHGLTGYAGFNISQGIGMLATEKVSADSQGNIGDPRLCEVRNGNIGDFINGNHYTGISDTENGYYKLLGEQKIHMRILDTLFFHPWAINHDNAIVKGRVTDIMDLEGQITYGFGGLYLGMNHMQETINYRRWSRGW